MRSSFAWKLGEFWEISLLLSPLKIAVNFRLSDIFVWERCKFVNSCKYVYFSSDIFQSYNPWFNFFLDFHKLIPFKNSGDQMFLCCFFKCSKMLFTRFRSVFTFYISWKISENQRFFDVIRRYGNGAILWNELRHFWGLYIFEECHILHSDSSIL